jgi:hypothetical protein
LELELEASAGDLPGSVGPVDLFLVGTVFFGVLSLLRPD